MESSPMLCKQGVTGSIPVTSTNFIFDRKVLTEFISFQSYLSAPIVHEVCGMGVI